jgi:phosphoribosyl 1,2-cyclic phosphodiesterase
MRFIPLVSSSRGNAYIVQDDGVPPLLLEAGLPIKQLRNKLREHKISLSNLAGCLISHEHLDHSKAVKDLLRAGVDCWMSMGTGIECEVTISHRLHIVGNNLFWIDGWSVQSFDLEHDAVEPKGFFIGHGNERLLFIADTGFVKNRFNGVTLIAVECNNIAELLSKNIQEGNIPAIVGKRVRRNHMSLENLKVLLMANDLSRCREIWLLHLSDGNSDERRMIKEIQEATGIPTEVCIVN